MSEATRHGLRRGIMLLLIVGTLFGGWQAYRKNQFDRQRDALLSEQAALLAKESAFQAAIDSDKVARVVIEPDGTISGFSAGAAALTNVPASEAVGQTLASLGLIAPGSAAELEAPPSGKTLKMILPLNRRDKKPTEVEARATPIGDGRGAIISFDRTRNVVELPAAPE